MVCTHYKKSCHDVATCFEIIGYHAQWTNTGGCGRSRGRGRTIGRGRGGPARVKVAVVSNTSEPSSSGLGSSFTLFLTYQWKALAGKFGNIKNPENLLTGTFNTHSWILDTGDTHHVTGDIT